MVISTVNQVVYNGDGITTAWPFTFRIIDATDIKLLLIDADGTETDVSADYYVDMVNNTVYYPGYAPGAEPPEEDQPPKVQTGQKLVVYRELPITQEKDLGDKWPFYVIELGLDKLTMILQQIFDWWGRTLKVSQGASVDGFNPDINPVANEVITVNADGDGFECREALMEVNGAWDGEGRQIKGVADPADSQDAATKNYVDTLTDNNFMKLQDDGTAWEGRSLYVSNVTDPYLQQDAATKNYVDGIIAGIVAQGNDVVVLSNVAIMKATDLETGMYVATAGYYNANDGGHGFYLIRANNSDVDDGGSVIILDNGNVAELIVPGYVKPEWFGAVGDGTTDCYAAINAMFTWVANNTTTLAGIKGNDYSSPSVILTGGKSYYLSQTVELTNNVLKIYGNGAAFVNKGIKFPAAYGWKLYIESTNFIDTDIAIDSDYRNLEYGNYVINNCIFSGCTIALQFKRRSCTVDVHNCVFRYCGKTAYLYNVDRFIFHENWVEAGTFSDNYHADIEQDYNAEGYMSIYNNLFVPGSNQTATECAWIEVNRFAHIYNNRFSGEYTGVYPVRIGSKFVASSNILQYPFMWFDHNEVYGTAPVLLNGLDGSIGIENNSGYLNGRPVIVWSSAISSGDQTTLISSAKYRLKIYINENNGVTFRNYYNNSLPAEYEPSVPDNLVKWINASTPNKQGDVQPWQWDYALSNDAKTITITVNNATNEMIRNTMKFHYIGSVRKTGGDYYSPVTFDLVLESKYDSGVGSVITEPKFYNVCGSLGQYLVGTINGASYVTASTAASDAFLASFTIGISLSHATCYFYDLDTSSIYPIFSHQQTQLHQDR